MTRFKTSQLAILGSLALASSALAQPAGPVAAPPAEPTTAEPAEPPVPEPEPVASEPPADDFGADADLNMDADTSTATTAVASKPPMENDSAAPWNLGAAPRLGLAIPTSKLGPFVSMGLELAYRLPAMDKRISALLDVSYTRPSREGTVNDMRVGGDADFDTKESEMKIGLGGSFRLFTDEKKLVPWAGAAAVMQRLKTTQTNDLAPGENTAEDTKFGGELFAGADYELGPGYVLGEARLVLTDLNDLITGNSNAGNVNLSAGYRFVF